MAAKKPSPSVPKWMLAAANVIAGVQNGSPRNVAAGINPSNWFGSTGGGGGASDLGQRAGAAARGALNNAVLNYYPVEESDEYYLNRVRELMGMGMDESTARSYAGGGGGGGGRGGGGGGGGGGGAAFNAMRDATLANVASTYGSAAATFNGSEDKYRAIHSEERATDTAGSGGAADGANQAAKAALAQRAEQRKVLGIEDAAPVVSDTIANEQKIATDTIAADDKRMETRAAGHLDNNLKFNTDLKAVVELEGKEKQKQIGDYYAGQLAQISARGGGGGGRGGGGRGGGRGGGGGGGGSRSGGSKGLTPGQLWNARGDLKKDDLRRLEAQYGPRYRQSQLSSYASQNPKMSQSQLLSNTKWIAGKGPYG